MLRRSRLSVRPNVGAAGRTGALATLSDAPPLNPKAAESPADTKEGNEARAAILTTTPQEDANENDGEGPVSSASVQRRKRFSIKPKVAQSTNRAVVRSSKTPVKEVSECPVQVPPADPPGHAASTASWDCQSPGRQGPAGESGEPPTSLLPSTTPAPPPDTPPEVASAEEAQRPEYPLASQGKEVPPKPPEKVPPSLPEKETMEVSERAKTLVSRSVKGGELMPRSQFYLSQLLNNQSDLQRLAKARKLRELLRQEMHKEKRHNKSKARAKEYTLDPAKMTMRDLIYYIPVSNPMSSYLEEPGQENETVLPPSPAREEVPEMAQKPEESPATESQADDEAMADGDQEEALMVPRVKVAEDGSLIIDEASLTVEVLRAKGPNLVEGRDPIFERGSTTTYSSFRKKTYTKSWSAEETDMFFLAVSMVGTDFSMICQLFPHRARSEIKNKFKKEERENAWRIDKAFRERRKLDLKFFSKLLEKIMEIRKKRSGKSKALSEKKATRKPRKKAAERTKKQLSDVEEELKDEDVDEEGQLEASDGVDCEDDIMEISEGRAAASLPEKTTGNKSGKQKDKEVESSKNEQGEACVPADAEAALPEDHSTDNGAEKMEPSTPARDSVIKPAQLSRCRAPKPLLALGRKWGKRAPVTKSKDAAPDEKETRSSEVVSEEPVKKDLSASTQTKKRKLDDRDDETSSKDEGNSTVTVSKPTRYGRMPKPIQHLNYPAKEDSASRASAATSEAPPSAEPPAVSATRPKCPPRRAKSSKTSVVQGSKKSKLVTLRASQLDYSDDEDDKQKEAEELEEQQHPSNSANDSSAPVFVPVGLRSPQPVVSEVEETMEELDILVDVSDALDISQDVLTQDASCLHAPDEMDTVPCEHPLDLLADVIDFMAPEHMEVSEEASYNEAAQTLLTIGNLAHLSQLVPNHTPDHITGLPKDGETGNQKEDDALNPFGKVQSSNTPPLTSEAVNTNILEGVNSTINDDLATENAINESNSSQIAPVIIGAVTKKGSNPESSEMNSPPKKRSRLPKPKPNLAQSSRASQSKQQTMALQTEKNTTCEEASICSSEIKPSLPTAGEPLSILTGCEPQSIAEDIPSTGIELTEEPLVVRKKAAGVGPILEVDLGSESSEKSSTAKGQSSDFEEKGSEVKPTAQTGKKRFLRVKPKPNLEKRSRTVQSEAKAVDATLGRPSENSPCLTVLNPPEEASTCEERAAGDGITCYMESPRSTQSQLHTMEVKNIVSIPVDHVTTSNPCSEQHVAKGNHTQSGATESESTGNSSTDLVITEMSLLHDNPLIVATAPLESQSNEKSNRGKRSRTVQSEAEAVDATLGGPAENSPCLAVLNPPEEASTCEEKAAGDGLTCYMESPRGTQSQLHTMEDKNIVSNPVDHMTTSNPCSEQHVAKGIQTQSGATESESTGNSSTDLVITEMSLLHDNPLIVAAAPLESRSNEKSNLGKRSRTVQSEAEAVDATLGGPAENSPCLAVLNPPEEASTCEEKAAGDGLTCYMESPRGTQSQLHTMEDKNIVSNPVDHMTTSYPGSEQHVTQGNRTQSGATESESTGNSSTDLVITEMSLLHDNPLIVAAAPLESQSNEKSNRGKRSRTVQSEAEAVDATLGGPAENSPCLAVLNPPEEASTCEEKAAGDGLTCYMESPRGTQSQLHTMEDKNIVSNPVDHMTTSYPGSEQHVTQGNRTQSGATESESTGNSSTDLVITEMSLLHDNPLIVAAAPLESRSNEKSNLGKRSRTVQSEAEAVDATLGGPAENSPCLAVLNPPEEASTCEEKAAGDGLTCYMESPRRTQSQLHTMEDKNIVSNPVDHITTSYPGSEQHVTQGNRTQSGATESESTGNTSTDLVITEMSLLHDNPLIVAAAPLESQSNEKSETERRSVQDNTANQANASKAASESQIESSVKQDIPPAQRRKLLKIKPNLRRATRATASKPHPAEETTKISNTSSETGPAKELLSDFEPQIGGDASEHAMPLHAALISGNSNSAMPATTVATKQTTKHDETALLLETARSCLLKDEENPSQGDDSRTCKPKTVDDDLSHGDTRSEAHSVMNIANDFSNQLTDCLDQHALSLDPLAHTQELSCETEHGDLHNSWFIENPFLTMTSEGSELFPKRVEPTVARGKTEVDPFSPKDYSQPLSFRDDSNPGERVQQPGSGTSDVPHTVHTESKDHDALQEHLSGNLGESQTEADSQGASTPEPLKTSQASKVTPQHPESITNLEPSHQPLSQQAVHNAAQAQSVACVTETSINSTKDDLVQSAAETQSYPILTAIPAALSVLPEPPPSDPDEPFFILSLTEIPTFPMGEGTSGASEPFPFVTPADTPVQLQSGPTGPGASEETLPSVEEATTILFHQQTYNVEKPQDACEPPEAVADTLLKEPLCEKKRKPVKARVAKSQPKSKPAGRKRGKQHCGDDEGEGREGRLVLTKVKLKPELNPTQPQPQPQPQPQTSLDPPTRSACKPDAKESCLAVTAETLHDVTRPPKTTPLNRPGRKPKGLPSFPSDSSAPPSASPTPPAKGACKGKRRAAAPIPTVTTNTPPVVSTATETKSARSKADAQQASSVGPRILEPPPPRASQGTAEVPAAQHNEALQRNSTDGEPTNITQYFFNDIFTEVDEG